MEMKEEQQIFDHVTYEKSGKKPMRIRPVKTMRLILLGILLCATVGTVCYFAGRFSDSALQNNVELDAVVLENQLNEISELSCVNWIYTNMAQFESSNEFYGMTLPFTTKKFILTYDGQIKAGIDLQKAAVSISGNHVTVQLPKAEILSHEINEDSIEVFDEKKSIFNPFTLQDFTAFQADQKKSMEEKALANGLITEAGNKAVSSVRLLLESILPKGYTLKVSYNV